MCITGGNLTVCKICVYYVGSVHPNHPPPACYTFKKIHRVVTTRYRVTYATVPLIAVRLIHVLYLYNWGQLRTVTLGLTPVICISFKCMRVCTIL